MPLPAGFLARFAVPLVVAAFTLSGNAPEQAAVYEKTMKESDRVLRMANKEGEGPVEYYDYIIVGAGAAGAVLANRLTADGTTTVLLLEGGGDPNPISEVPWFQDYLGSGGMMLEYETVPQEKGCLTNGGKCWFPRGIALGGSTSVNGLVYNRCNAKDYDSWANFTGDPIWRFDSVVDAFRAIENYHGVYEENPGPNHGTSGEIHVSHLDYTPGFEILEQALTEKGIGVGDLNSGLFPSGFSKLDHNVKDGLRWSAYHGFIEPILGRPNLKVYRYAWVTKVLLDGSNKAQGVIYSRHGDSYFVGANKEVILAAGVIDTPKILMLSGIGPREHLAEHGITTILDLPVGNYLQEHLGLNMYPWAINRTIGLVNPVTPENIQRYIQNATGPLAQLLWWGKPAVHIANGYFSSRTHNDPTWPDLHCYVNEYLIAPEGKPIEQQIQVELEMVLTNQIGTIRLHSTDPMDPPIIDPMFLQDQGDIDRLIEGIEYLTDLFMNSTTFQALGIHWSDNVEKVQECEHLPFPSREFWECLVIYHSHPALHPTSTCRMGPNSSVAVVDSKLRVFGAQNLRIVDSSVIPFVPNGNTNFPSMMVGEMGARIILEQV